MDFLLLNIGNTHTAWVSSDASGNFSNSGSVDTAAWMENVLLLPEVDCKVNVWGACVVPLAKMMLEKSAYYKNIQWVDCTKASAAGVDFSLIDTSTIGADRVANAVALLKYPLPAANLDCGTAVTLEVVLENGVFAGGAIMPGRKLMRRSLAAGTGALPEIPISFTLPEELGRNTADALQLGIDRGAIGMVENLINMLKAQNISTFLASGGDRGFFCRALPQLIDAGDELTLRGIFAIACKHTHF